MTYERHDLSAKTGEMSPELREELQDHIYDHGLIEPIELWEGKILDGWHRYQACIEAAVAPRFQEFVGNLQAAKAHVIGKITRKETGSASKRGIVVAGVNSWYPQGRPAQIEQTGNVAPLAKTIDEMAGEAHVSRRTMVDSIATIKAGQEDRILKGGESVSKVAAEIREAVKPKPKKEKPKKLSELEELRAEVIDLREHLVDRQDKLDMVIMELQSFTNASEDVMAQQIEFLNLREQLRLTEQARDAAMNELVAWKRENKTLRKRLGMKP